MLRSYDPAVAFLQQLDTVPVCSEIIRVERVADTRLEGRIPGRIAAGQEQVLTRF